MWPALPATRRLAGFIDFAAHGGFAPNGIVPILTGAVAATGFYFGAEIVTIAAAEAPSRRRRLRKATNSVITRVLVFYVGSILLVVAIVPWNSPGDGDAVCQRARSDGHPRRRARHERHRPDGGALGAELRPLRLVADAVRADQARRRAEGPRPSSAATACRCAPSWWARCSATPRWSCPTCRPDTVFAFLVDSYGTVAIFVYVLDRRLAAAAARPAGTRGAASACACGCGAIPT